MRPIAAKAALRARQKRWRSASSAATRISSAVAAEVLELGELRLDLGLGAVELDQQRRAGVEREAGVGHRLGGLDGEVVHHLDRGRDDARARDRGDRLAGLRWGSRRRRRACGPPPAWGRRAG